MLYSFTLISLIEVILIFVPTLLVVAYTTLAERKATASMQRRLGPNFVGYYGLLQAFADALKLLLKKYVAPIQSNIILFFFGPIITLVFSLLGYAVIPYGPGIVITDYILGILYMLAVSSLATYGILLAGWSVNSKYAFLGSLRSTAQLISYELILSSAILIVIMIIGNLNLTVCTESQRAIWLIFPLFPIFIIFFIGSIAETIRAPFDLAEAESELVSGFMTEHDAGFSGVAGPACGRDKINYKYNNNQNSKKEIKVFESNFRNLLPYMIIITIIFVYPLYNKEIYLVTEHTINTLLLFYNSVVFTKILCYIVSAVIVLIILLLSINRGIFIFKSKKFVENNFIIIMIGLCILNSIWPLFCLYNEYSYWYFFGLMPFISILRLLYLDFENIKHKLINKIHFSLYILLFIFIFIILPILYIYIYDLNLFNSIILIFKNSRYIAILLTIIICLTYFISMPLQKDYWYNFLLLVSWILMCLNISMGISNIFSICIETTSRGPVAPESSNKLCKAEALNCSKNLDISVIKEKPLICKNWGFLDSLINKLTSEWEIDLIRAKFKYLPNIHIKGSFIDMDFNNSKPVGNSLFFKDNLNSIPKGGSYAGQGIDLKIWSKLIDYVGGPINNILRDLTNTIDSINISTKVKDWDDFHQNVNIMFGFGKNKYNINISVYMANIDHVGERMSLSNHISGNNNNNNNSTIDSNNTMVPNSQPGSTTTSQAEQVTAQQLVQIANAALNHESSANKRSYSDLDSGVESEARASKRPHIEAPMSVVVSGLTELSAPAPVPIAVKWSGELAALIGPSGPAAAPGLGSAAEWPEAALTRASGPGPAEREAGLARPSWRIFLSNSESTDTLGDIPRRFVFESQGIYPNVNGCMLLYYLENIDPNSSLKELGIVYRKSLFLTDISQTPHAVLKGAFAVLRPKVGGGMSTVAITTSDVVDNSLNYHQAMSDVLTEMRRVQPAIFDSNPERTRIGDIVAWLKENYKQ